MHETTTLLLEPGEIAAAGDDIALASSPSA
jgi:hypothetical protein